MSTATYDANDELASSIAPQDTSTSPARTTTYTYDNVGNKLTQTSPDGNVSGAPAGSYITHYGYDTVNEPTTVTDPLGNVTTTSYDDVGNVYQVIDPLKHNTSSYLHQYGYDRDHRRISDTDALGNVSKTAYGQDGLKSSTTDQNNNTTLFSYDQNGQVTQEQVPHTSSGGTITYDTVQYQYDQVGNQTTVISPRGVASGIANAYTTTTQYDPDNRKSKVFGAYNPNDPTYKTAPETDYSYDDAGRLTKVTAPPSGSSTVNSVTTTSYWDNGWTKSSTDPWSITTSYDYNALGKQTSRTLTSAGGSSSRTQAWTYYPDGKLESRSDNGIPVGLQVEMVDNSDSQNVSSTGTWTSSSTGSGYNGYDYQTHTAGSGTDAFTWNLNIPEDGNYTVYAQYPQVSGAATNASYTINYNGGTTTKTIDQTANTGTWVSLGSYSFTQAGTGQTISLAENSGGTVTADAIKVVRDNSGDTQPNPNSFTYTYDPNGSLTDLADNSPGAQYNDYSLSYDGLNRLTQLQEKLSGTVKHTTGFSYDADSSVLSETHDASSASYQYDVRNLLAQVVNKETSSDAGRTTGYTHTPTGKIATETKANGNVVTTTYNLDDSIASTIEKTSGGATVAQHTYTYDPNGNVTQDASVTQNADNNSTDLNRTATNTYTPRDQIETVTNSDGNNNQSYTYDLAGNISSQTVGGTTTTNVYDRNRLLTATASGTTADYNYDPFGRTDTVTAAGQVIQRYTYDGFDRIATETKNTGTGNVATNYTYDPFNRTISQTDNAGTTNAKTTNYDYLATSNALADETVNGTVTKTYQYASTGERLDQIIHNSDGTEDTTYYSYNAHADVQAITDTNGNTKATYGYTAYGKDDTSQDTGVDKNTGNGSTGTTATTPYNVYRFNSARIDDNTGNYNMGFRNYDPGTNRFLTRDMYEGAFADTAMTTDPYTGNRYAFGAGNPISNIELDGHRPDVCMAGGDAGACRAYSKGMAENAERNTSSSGSSSSSGYTGLKCVPLTGNVYIGNCDGSSPQNSLLPGAGLLGMQFQWPVQLWTGAAKRNAEQAGIDPSLLLAVTLMESRKAQAVYDAVGEDSFVRAERFEVYLWNHGLWFGPNDGPSLGITNVKPGVFDTVSKEYPTQFKGTEWSDLAGNDALSMKVTAYYLKYLKDKYAGAAAPRLSKNSPDRAISNEVLYGIYNGGEDQFRRTLSNGYFGPVVSGNISTMDSFIPQAQKLILGPGVSIS